MREQILQPRPSLVASIVGVFALAGLAAPALAQNGIGQKYNSRDPRSCRETPSKSKAPTLAEAVESVICNSEHEAGIETLYLLEDVKVSQVGVGSPYKPGVDGNVQDIDPGFLIYPIRGSLKRYQCTLSTGVPPEKSCRLTGHPNAAGRCYKDGFGQWRCSMSDGSVRESVKVFPPGGAKTTDAPVNEKPKLTIDSQRAGKPTGPTVDNPAHQPPGRAEGRRENGFPKPDFGEMEAYFEIVSSDYDPKLGRFNLLVKAKKKTNVFEWYLTFYDADGIKVMDRSFNANMGSPELGEPTKIYGYVPTPQEMKQVTRIAISRRPF